MKKILSYYWLHAKGLRKYAWWTIAAYTLGYILNSVIRPIAIQRIIDGLVHHTDQIPILIGVFIALLFGKEICFRGGDFIIARFELGHAMQLRRASLASLLERSLGFFGSTFSGALVAKQRRFVTSGEALFDEIAYQHLFIAIQVVGIIVVSAKVSPYLMANYAFWLSATITLIVLAFKKRMRLDKDEAAAESRVTGRFADIIGNIPTVKLFGAKQREKEEYETVCREHYALRMRAWKYSSIQSAIIGMSTTGMYASTIFICYHLWKQGHFTPGDFVLMITYSAMLSETLWISNRSLRKFSQAIADASEMAAIMQEPVEIRDTAADQTDLHVPIRNVTFKNVCFAYPNGTPIFDHFSLQITAGQKVAIIGPTGSGKTTLINLLLRNIEAQSGNILLEPYNIRTDFTQDTLKSYISTVSQSADLFHRTIRENIAYGKPDATDEEIYTAARKAQIHEFILKQNDGYDTLVGERGVHLSGGQKQRIAIARALLHNAPVLIFDEATSSLDNVTEKQIQDILENELREKTVIIIAHRLSTIEKCDRILVLSEGTILQDGTHSELVADTTGLYYKMLNSHEVAAQAEIQS